MKILTIVDEAVDNGCTHISLSPNQYRTLKRELNLSGDIHHYRGVKVSTWKRKRLRPDPAEWKRFNRDTETYESIADDENKFLDRANRNYIRSRL